MTKGRTFLTSGGIGDHVHLHCFLQVELFTRQFSCTTIILDSVSRLFSFAHAMIAFVVSYHVLAAMFGVCPLQFPNSGLFSCCHDPSYILPL